MRRVHILAVLVVAAAAVLAGPDCGRDRFFGKSDRPSADARAHRRKRPHEHRGAPDTVASAPPGTASVHLALGTPVDADPRDDWLMIKPQYALSYNATHLGANWVSWEINAGYYGDAPRHKGKFLPDDTLPDGWYRVRHDDYARSDYDRGHMVRSEERTRSRADNASTFLMTNILPQRHELNAGPWLRLEERCRELAQLERKEMFITAGPIFGPRPETIGHGVAVPEAFFKIIVVLGRDQGPADVTSETRVIAVIMPNEHGISEEPWSSFRTSVAEIERRTGYRFLTNVPAATRRVLVKRVDAEP